MGKITFIWYCTVCFLIATTCYGMTLQSQQTSVDEESSQVIRAFPEKIQDLLFLTKLKLNILYDTWLEPRGIGLPVDILARGKTLTSLKEDLERNGISYEIFIPNVEIEVKRNIAENNAALKLENNHNSFQKNYTWTAYHTYAEIVQWMNDLSNSYPATITLIKVGRSYEYRPMYVVKLSKKSHHPKPAVWIDGGMHGREWISPAVVTYMLNELVENPIYSPVLNNVDFYFMPVMNPDGYVYTFTAEGRLWRKTRSKNRSLRGCVGTDPNRNWNFHWKETIFDLPCSDTYPGEAPFSEKEMQITKTEIMSNALHMKAYLSYHSYAQLWLFPWGYTVEKVPDFEELEALSSNAVNAIYTYNGTRYRQQPMCIQEELCIYGDSIDWIKGVLRIKYPFQVQLPDQGYYGYLLPPTKIIPTGEESLRGLLVIANTLAKEGKEKT